jgi:hypothetical protein
MGIEMGEEGTFVGLRGRRWTLNDVAGYEVDCWDQKEEKVERGFWVSGSIMKGGQDGYSRSGEAWFAVV